MWRQLIDKPDCWVETSGSAMFTYAFIMGVKYGWLPVKEYGEATRRAWLAMLTYINSNDKVREVCVGTNKRTTCSIIMIVRVIREIIMDMHPIFGVRLLFWKITMNTGNSVFY